MANGGAAAARSVRASAGPNRNAPILAFTADVQAELGPDHTVFDGIVSKPIVAADLAAAVAACVAHSDPEGGRQVG